MLSTPSNFVSEDKGYNRSLTCFILEHDGYSSGLWSLECVHFVIKCVDLYNDHLYTFPYMFQ